MVRDPKKETEPPVDPRGGDEILKRMLQTKPKTHNDMVADRKKQRRSAPDPKK